MAINPIVDAYDAIYQGLLANADIAALFLGGTNQSVQHLPNYHPANVYYATDPDIVSPNMADYPRARLLFMPEGDDNQDLQDTSDGSSLRVTYVVEVSTGHQIQTRLMLACWALWTFSANWQSLLFNAVQYNSKPCVLYAKPRRLAAEEVNTNDHKNRARGTDQWVAVWSLLIGFNFSTQDLQAIG
jgi:hypothetical protein